MTVSVLKYSLSALARERAAAAGPVEQVKSPAKTPNKRSLAKKRWWAEKKAREAAEREAG